jgi:hypothetical protein
MNLTSYCLPLAPPGRPGSWAISVWWPHAPRGHHWDFWWAMKCFLCLLGKVPQSHLCAYAYVPMSSKLDVTKSASQIFSLMVEGLCVVVSRIVDTELTFCLSIHAIQEFWQPPCLLPNTLLRQSHHLRPTAPSVRWRSLPSDFKRKHIKALQERGLKTTSHHI